MNLPENNEFQHDLINFTSLMPYDGCLLSKTFKTHFSIMEKIWNDFDLKKPPFVTLPSKHSKYIPELHAAIETYISKQSQHDEEFNETAALLSRLMARRKNSFSKMKGFKDICKLNAALCRLLRVDFKRELDIFRSTLPDVEYEENTIIHLPTQDSYDFLLLRLVAVYELHQRICYCCLNATEYFISQLRLHYFFDISTLFLAVLAKIFNLSVKLANLAVSLYNQILLFRSILPIHIKSEFSNAKQFGLPTMLEKIKLKSLKNIKSDESEIGESQINELLKQEHKLGAVKATSFKKSDIGKQIERGTNTKTSFDIQLLETVEDIQRFILMESKSRTKNLNMAITKQILSHEWSGATKLFERKVKNGEAKKALNIFLKFLKSKIS